MNGVYLWRPKAYAVRRGCTLLASLALAAMVSFLGHPPPKNVKIEEMPLQLKQRRLDGYGPQGLMLMKVSVVRQDGSSALYCAIPSTTSVRQAFDKAGAYVERTRLTRELCQVPSPLTFFEVTLTVPYRPEEGSFQHTLNSCTHFEPVAAGWRAYCNVSVQQDAQPVRVLVYEAMDQALNSDRHNRRADLVDVLFVKKEEKP